MFGHLEPQATGQLTQAVCLEAELNVLASYRVGKRCDMFLNANPCVFDNIMVGQVADGLVGMRQKLVTILWTSQLFDDEGEAATVRRVEFALGVPQRGQVDVADLLALLRFRVRPGILPCMEG